MGGDQTRLFVRKRYRGSHVHVRGAPIGVSAATRYLSSRCHPVNATSSDCDLSAAVSDALGIEIHSPLIRASYTGWLYEPGLGALCPKCSNDLELFGCESTARDGSRNRLMAFVCVSCEVLLWPYEVTATTRECAKLCRAFRLARHDALTSGASEEYFIYVIELDGVAAARPKGTDAALPWVYVGQSAKTPEERMQQHLDGYKSSRWAHRYGSHLRPDLYEGHPPLTTRRCALTYETWLAASLRSKGYPVQGGH